MEPTLCHSGTYSPEGVFDCINCSVGHYCPNEGGHAQIPCPTGFYGLTERLASCTECPRGKFCYLISCTKTPCNEAAFHK